jgi:hypothetical protein
VYAPGTLVPGVNVPLTGTLPGASHDPEPLGEPPRTEINEKGALVLHTVIVPLTPALGAITRFTWTDALALTQGVVPATV